MQLTWVGQVPVKDMRHLLLVLPPAVILLTYTISKTEEDMDRKNMFFIPIYLTLFIDTGFLMVYYDINWHINSRELEQIFNPPLIPS